MSDKQQIYELMPKVMKSIGAIEKGDLQKFDKYMYRSIEDTMEACQKAFLEHSITITSSVREASYDSGTNLYSAIYSFTFYAPDGSSVTSETFVTGHPAKKGFNVGGTAYSYGFKEAVFKTFSVPVQQDGDGDREGEGKPEKASNSKASKAKFKMPTAKQLEGMTIDELRALYPLAKANGASDSQLERIKLAAGKVSEKESEVDTI